MLRGLAWLSAGIVIGFMLGGIGPAFDLARARKDLAVAQRERDQVSGGFRSVVPGFDQALQVGQPPPAARARPPQSDPQPSAAGAPAAAGGPAPSRLQRRRERLERFDDLEAGQKLRAAQSRAALIEQAGLDPEQLARFDAALVRMNAELAGYSGELMELYLSDHMPSPQQMLSVGHEVSGVMLDAQKVLDEMVGPTQPGDRARSKTSRPNSSWCAFSSSTCTCAICRVDRGAWPVAVSVHVR